MDMRDKQVHDYTVAAHLYLNAKNAQYDGRHCS